MKMDANRFYAIEGRAVPDCSSVDIDQFCFCLSIHFSIIDVRTYVRFVSFLTQLEHLIGISELIKTVIQDWGDHSDSGRDPRVNGKLRWRVTGKGPESYPFPMTCICPLSIT